MDEVTTVFDAYEGMTIPSIIVDAFKTMTTGVTGSIKETFDNLVLNDAGTGLSMLAIWSLTMAGIGIAPFILRKAVNFFKSRKRSF